ncbi:MAG: OmpA family protein [Gammaproteobacteria bacterium]|nr:OmpA family protein [Gammaproteobacteria bacterium]MDH5344915.1 OmpA family protein [Gammaproteobacteria bacterium]
MIRKTVLFGLAMTLAASAAYAGSPSKEEKAGVGAGIVIGAAAGGPIGAIVGAAFGAKIGDEFFKRNDEVDSLSASLAASESRAASLEHNITALKGDIRSRDDQLRQARALARPDLVALLEAGIEMDLLFRTDEDVLSGTTGGKLGQLAASLVANPDIRIRLDGYADERGDETYNQALSARRVQHVRDVLVAAGVPDARISASAHGESPATEQTTDSFALERRVSLTLYTGETPSFASNPQ